MRSAVVFLLAAFGRTFWLAVIAAAAVTSFAGSAFTGTLAGAQTSKTSTSASVIGGYTVSNVAYTLNANTPANVDAITFTIVAPGSQPTFVKAQPVTGGTFYTCTTVLSGADYNATCATTAPQWTLVSSLTNMTTLTIVIRQ